MSDREYGPLTYTGLPPASAAWREGDQVGHRLFLDTGAFVTDSGFEFPWSPFRLLPFSASATYHDYHHSHNRGNFSS